jgi:short-subunit dehydrogenase
MTYKLPPTLIARKGAIVNLSSVAGSYPYPGGNVYGATKAFVRQFSLDLRSDLHAPGVRVTSIEPGMAKTDFTLVRTGGDQAAADALYAGFEPLTADDLAETFYLLHFADYDAEELWTIFRALASAHAYHLSPAADVKLRRIFTLAWQSRRTSFGNARFARKLEHRRRHRRSG